MVNFVVTRFGILGSKKRAFVYIESLDGTFGCFSPPENLGMVKCFSFESIANITTR